MAAGKLVSVNVGLPRDVPWRGRVVHTGVWKTPVDGRRLVRRLNVEGDGQGDLAGHGGEQRAVLVYQLDSYRHWRDVLGREELGHGAFGENFTVEGLADDEVCIGDRYRIGEAEFEVTQPRVTCFRVGMRLAEPRLASLLVSHGRPGFYLRVLREGYVEAGDAVRLLRRGPHGLTVAEADGLLYLPGHDPARLRDALDVPALSPGWRGSFATMLDEGRADGAPAGVLVAPPPAWRGFRSLTVAEVVAEAGSVTSYVLVADDPLPPFAAGQFVTVRADGAGDPAPVRSYSLSGDSGTGRYRISVKRRPLGVVTSYLQDRLRVGDRLDVAAPRGGFVLDDSTDPLLLVSAGIGVTPVLAMLHELARAGSARDVWWIHTTRDATTHAFSAEAGALLAQLASAHEVVQYTGRGGRLTRELLAALGLPAAARAYVCGPEPFMDDVTGWLGELGLTDVHTERFGSHASLNPGVVPGASPPPHLPPGPPGQGPAVTFARSGVTAPWSEAYQSVLELAEACDVPTQWSCRTGVCHTCATPVLSGESTYVAEPLEAPGPDELLVCVARPTTELVLDL